MVQLNDRTGKVYSRLTALSRAESTGPVKWLCRCECGNLLVTSGSNLTSGKTKSCGCLWREGAQARLTIHGFSSHPLFQTWKNMKSRCQNPRHPRYSDWGGRGIKCLLPSPQALEDCIGLKPSPQHSVDRINNAGHYEPGNLRWATTTEQNRNQSSNRILTWQGESQCVTEWAVKLGVSPSVIYNRLSKGWSVERTLSTPTLSQK